jgi:hypothetical protein
MCRSEFREINRNWLDLYQSMALSAAVAQCGIKKFRAQSACRFQSTLNSLSEIRLFVPCSSIMLNAFAIALLTLLGATGEALGYDLYLKSNTTKRRTHSLFRQGCMLYELIPTMPEVRLLPLIERFTTMLAELPVFADTFGAI